MNIETDDISMGVYATKTSKIRFTILTHIDNGNVGGKYIDITVEEAEHIIDVIRKCIGIIKATENPP